MSETGEDQGNSAGWLRVRHTKLGVMARTQVMSGLGVQREMAKCRGLAGGRGAGWVQGTDSEDTENWEVQANWPFGNLPS